MKDRLLLVGKKVGMTQLFDNDNRLLPVTVVLAEPCVVSQIKTAETDGYTAVQLAYGIKNKVTAPIAGHLKKASVEENLSCFKEFTTDDVSAFSLGQSLNTDLFAEGQLVDAVAVSKGKGFQGVVFRYEFGGGRATHGSMSHRRGGSYGNRQQPAENDRVRHGMERHMQISLSLKHMDTVCPPAMHPS